MADMNWKRFEREVARKLGGRRVPVTGLGRAEADVDGGPFQYQIKLGRRKPGYLTEWVDGIVETATRKGAIGIVVWKAPREKDDDAIVILRLADWQRLCWSQKKKKRPTIKPSVSFKSAPLT